MILNFILTILGAIIFLNSLHFLSKDDFTLLRKNISLEQVFNLAFLVFFIGILSSRIYFVLLHFKKIYLNPLVFLHIINFPGLSIYGAMLGAIIFLYIYLKRKSAPIAKLFDIFSLAFLTILPLTIVPLLITKKFSLFLILNIAIFLIYIITNYSLYKLFFKNRAKPGNIGFYILFLFSTVTFVQNFFEKNTTILFVFTLEQIIIVAVCIVLSVFFLLKKTI